MENGEWKNEGGEMREMVHRPLIPISQSLVLNFLTFSSPSDPC